MEETDDGVDIRFVNLIIPLQSVLCLPHLFESRKSKLRQVPHHTAIKTPHRLLLHGKAHIFYGTIFDGGLRDEELLPGGTPCCRQLKKKHRGEPNADAGCLSVGRLSKQIDAKLFALITAPPVGGKHSERCHV
ncbi:hypothetical protein FR483_n027R [Paramecium bursaria Chlorella virus FR483]|uniref:Uncharacterized protein n027R n=1 Tax=Paramecium bursaria Chlorella virus FR483 TaxID=399781 RepID=A7J681_PBCVF|nr:hypothetical protein FR483_n027R [Paramecium bursaria Chlorella virus FR483]ABT15312.1 hypothetical protein FR483_n027R [Paramecium bursaria Chlorella virus FR483]